MAIATVALSPKQQRQAERKRLRLSSLNTQLAWWASPDRKGEGFQISALRAEVKRIQKAISRLSTLVPSATWLDDARGLSLDKGGDFPPKDENGVPLMAKALGESRYYPPPYLTSSGHSFDTYVEAVYTGASAQLYDDGYMGGRVTIYQLTRSERRRLHLLERSRKSSRHKGFSGL